jgi:CheY-like chemotaxis protein
LQPIIYPDFKHLRSDHKDMDSDFKEITHSEKRLLRFHSEVNSVTPKNNFPNVSLAGSAGTILQQWQWQAIDRWSWSWTMKASSPIRLAAILSQSGYAAISAYDGEAALETALLMPPEMLITDVVLPGMSGIELAITIKRVFPDCKIILFSGQAATSDLIDRARRNGHEFELLSKPLHPSVLLTRLSERLSQRRQQMAVSQ